MQPDPAVAALLNADAVRERCHELLDACERGALPHFVLVPERLAGVADYVADEVRRNYPSLEIPFHSRWRHFEPGGIDRISPLLAGVDGPERARIRFDLAITSVLLDAGAGAAWRWTEPGTGLELARSEGLGVASPAPVRLGRPVVRPRASASGRRGRTLAGHRGDGGAGIPGRRGESARRTRRASHAPCGRSAARSVRTPRGSASRRPAPAICSTR